MTTMTVTKRTVEVALTDAPDVEGTAGLSGNTRTVSPVRAMFTEAREGDGHAIRVWGPNRKKDGSLSASHFEVLLTTRAAETYLTPAPEWLAHVVREAFFTGPTAGPSA